MRKMNSKASSCALDYVLLMEKTHKTTINRFTIHNHFRLKSYFFNFMITEFESKVFVDGSESDLN